MSNPILYNLILYRAGYKYQLAKTARIPLEFIRPSHDIWFRWCSITQEGLLEILEGYAWDGPSGPTMDTKNAMRGSLVHDAVFQLIRLGFLPRSFIAAANHEYQRICLEDGMSRFRAWLHFTALAKFGSSAAEPSAERPILHAP